MENPAHALAAWLRALDAQTRSDVAFLLVAMHPAFNAYGLPDGADAQLAEIEGRLDAMDGSHPEVGFLLATEAIFNYLFVHRGTEEGWERPLRIFRATLADERATDGMKELARRSIDEMPANLQRWATVIASWQDLRARHLTRDNLERWAMDGLKMALPPGVTLRAE